MDLIPKYREQLGSIVECITNTYYLFSTDGMVILGQFKSHRDNEAILESVLVFSDEGITATTGYKKVNFALFHCEPLTRSSMIDLKKIVDTVNSDAVNEQFYQIFTTLIDLDPC